MRQVELHYPTDGTKPKYIGRFIGFIKDDEFNAICQSKNAASRIESKETKPLIGICTKHDTLKGYRIVMVIKKSNNISIPSKKLFISEKLDYISLINKKEKKVIFESEDGDNIVIREI